MEKLSSLKIAGPHALLCSNKSAIYVLLDGVFLFSMSLSDFDELDKHNNLCLQNNVT
jgi:hypothetical protein